MPLKPGDKAPDFTLLDQHGEPFMLSKSLENRRAHLIFFYPKADTPGCTTQACGLRDALPDLGHTTVVGISPDPPTKQESFAQKFSLGYPLLSDPEHQVAEAYEAWGQKSMYGRSYMGIIRSAFLIEGDGNVAEAWYKVSPKDTAVKLRQALAR